jgi:hypothetical protein
MRTPFIYTFIALWFAASTGYAQDSQGAKQWVKDERTLDGDATIYLSNQFSAKSGTFSATPESVMDKKNKITGNFTVGSYRFVYDKPVTDEGPAFDEMVSTEIMDCAESYFGTLKKIKKLKGVEVQSRSFKDSEVSMTQMRMANMGSKLCALKNKTSKPSIDPKNNANPSYRGDRPINSKETDALIDKYKRP